MRRGAARSLALALVKSIHLILAGGGHAHVEVLFKLALRPEPAFRLSLISPHAQALYTGMVPGIIAGQYSLNEAQIDLAALAEQCGAQFVIDRIATIDPHRRIVELENGDTLAYDLLALDIGSRPALEERIGADAPVSRVKPIEVAATEIEAALRQAPPPGGREVVIVGAGAGGCEIAFAIAARLRREGGGKVTVCDAAPLPVSSRHPDTSVAVLRAFDDKGIVFEGDIHVMRAESHGVRLADGRNLPANLIVWATGAAGPALFQDAGLPLDERGFLRVDDDLRCADFPEIFAAGDCATLASHPTLAKAGVYAVRQAPVLEANLRAAARGKPTRPFRPQQEFLSLLNTADGRAIYSRGSRTFHGRLAWWLKDFIDRKYVRRFRANG